MQLQRHEIFQKSLDLERVLGDTKRESELQAIKIESLQNVITKREQQQVGFGQRVDSKKSSWQQTQNSTHNKKDLMTKIEKLERDKRQL